MGNKLNGNRVRVILSDDNDDWVKQLARAVGLSNSATPPTSPEHIMELTAISKEAPAEDRLRPCFQGNQDDPRLPVASWVRNQELDGLNSDYRSNVSLNMIGFGLNRAALKDGGPPVLDWGLGGSFFDKMREHTIAFQKQFGLRAISRGVYERGFGSLLIRDSDGSGVETDSCSSVRAISRDPDFIQKVDDYWRDLLPKYKTLGSVYVMLADNGGIKFHQIDDCGVPFVPGNYNPEVVAAYQRIVASLEDKDPAGRISVLTGPPGCGKTFLMKALLQETKGVKFVIVPAATVADMASPGFLPSLLAFGRENQIDKRTIVFLIEDADECLARRDSGNRNAVSALLNFGDGILGSALDIRVVATTNEGIKDLDEALTRPGRMGTIQEVGALQEPWKVMGRLIGKPDLSFDEFLDMVPKRDGVDPAFRPRDMEMTLAQVYSIFKDRDWSQFNSEATSQKKSVGFR